VRAVVVNQHAWIGNGGGQRTARPTRRCAKVKPECRNGTGVARETWYTFSTRSARAGTARCALSLPFYAMARSGIRVHIKPDSGVELGMKRSRSTAYSLSSMKWRRGRGEEARLYPFEGPQKPDRSGIRV